MPHYSLREVFGVYPTPPKQTYVDRSGYDERVNDLLETGRHLVIYGPSKQGKTALRKHAIPDDRCLIVQCRLGPDTEAIYLEILRQIGTQRTVNTEASKGGDLSVTGGGSGGVNFLTLFKGDAKLEGQASVSGEIKTLKEPVGNSAATLSFVADEIKNSRRRVVIEDFHYIPEPAKKILSFDLKALYEYEVPIVLIGAWEEPHLLINYNGDLSGRIEEINLTWTDRELRQVLTLGQTSLNIEFSAEIIREMISDASGNVGLLQRIAEKLCKEAGCNKTEAGQMLEITDIKLLVAARKHICSEEAVRYRNFAAVSEGFLHSPEKIKSVYMRILQVWVEASDAELISGLPQPQIIERVRAIEPTITQRNVKDALERIDKLQSEKNIYPIIATFNVLSRTLNLADRELLFYRKYGGPRWPWENDEDE